LRSFIQWLFPIREEGMNSSAQRLYAHEIKAICDDKEAHARVLKSYEVCNKPALLSIRFFSTHASLMRALHTF
jgi:hypothetical protein